MRPLPSRKSGTGSPGSSAMVAVKATWHHATSASWHCRLAMRFLACPSVSCSTGANGVAPEAAGGVPRAPAAADVCGLSPLGTEIGASVPSCAKEARILPLLKPTANKKDRVPIGGTGAASYSRAGCSEPCPHKHRDNHANHACVPTTLAMVEMRSRPERRQPARVR